MREKRTIQELQAEQDKEKFKRIREKAEVNKSRAQEVNSDAPEYSPQQEQPSPVRVIIEISRKVFLIIFSIGRKT